jgi:hypothetical protein
MILPEFYYNCLRNYLSESQLLTLEILVWLLQVHKQVRLERLAACFPLPIIYESRRRHLQRFLLLPSLSVPLVWFPLIKYILRTQIPLGSRVVVPLDRTQWKSNNLLMISVIWKKRALAYWSRKYRGKAHKEGWYILTNLSHPEEAIKAYQARSGIEALFKDCKSGGYNLEGSKAATERLTRLVLLIAIAYTFATLYGQTIKHKGIQNYVNRLK